MGDAGEANAARCITVFDEPVSRSRLERGGYLLSRQVRQRKIMRARIGHYIGLVGHFSFVLNYAPFQIRRPRSDVEKGHGDCSSNAATTAKINRGEGSHSNFIIWTKAEKEEEEEGRARKDDQVLITPADHTFDDGGCSETIGNFKTYYR